MSDKEKRQSLEHTPTGIDPRIIELLKRRLAERDNGKPMIPASWVPFLFVGSTLSAAFVTTAQLLPTDVPRVLMVIGCIGLATFGPLLAASPGLRKGPSK